MKSIGDMSQGEFAAYIDSHLQLKNIRVVLSGGATVAIYSENKYVSKDLDFICIYFKDEVAIASAMQELGFQRQGKYYFHEQSPFFVEFLTGPPSVGNDPIGEIREIEMVTGKLRIISPTDSVKDRLASYYYWDDRQGLEQAVLVANSTEIDLDEIRKWSKKEKQLRKFHKFCNVLRE